MERAWAEIRDTVVDHGGSWPRGSPRAIGQEVGDRLEHDEADSMGQMATLVERSRYARTFVDSEAAGQLPAVTQDIRRGIAAPSGPVRKALAVLLPRSVFPAASVGSKDHRRDRCPPNAHNAPPGGGASS